MRDDLPARVAHPSPLRGSPSAAVRLLAVSTSKSPGRSHEVDRAQTPPKGSFQRGPRQSTVRAQERPVREQGGDEALIRRRMT